MAAETHFCLGFVFLPAAPAPTAILASVFTAAHAVGAWQPGIFLCNSSVAAMCAAADQCVLVCTCVSGGVSVERMLGEIAANAMAWMSVGMDMNLGHYFPSYIPQESRATDRGTLQEPVVFSTLNLSSVNKSAKPDLGHSFLALLSGSPQQPQHEFQQLPFSKPHVVSSKLSFQDSSILASGASSGHSTARFTSFPQLNSNKSIGSGTELCPVVTSRPLPTAIGSQNGLQMAHLQQRSAESAEPIFSHAVHGSNIGREILSSSHGLIAGANVLNGGQNGSQHQNKTVQALSQMPSEAYSTSVHLPAFPRGYPRVFCLGTGSSAVNPGEAVRLESGETIAQWRRGYCIKFSMRLPDDNSGWDWPDGIYSYSGLMKCKTTFAPSFPMNIEVSQPIDSFGALLRSGQSRNDSSSSSIPYIRKPLLEKSIKKILTHEGQKKNVLDGHIALNSFVGNSHVVLPSPSNTQMLQSVKEGTISKCMTVLKPALEKVAQNNEHQTLFDYAHSIGKGGNPFIGFSNSGNLKSFDTVSNTNRHSNSGEAFITDRDAISSNIELRLGQPSQQSQTLRGSISSSFHPQLFGACHPPKFQFSEPLDIGGCLFADQAATDTRAMEGSRQLACCVLPCVSGPNLGEKESQSNFISQALRSPNAIDSAKLDPLKGDAAKSSLISMFLSRFSTQLGGSIQSQAPHNWVSRGENFVPRTDGIESKSHANGGGVSENIDKGKGLNTVADDCSRVAAKFNSLFSSKQVVDASPFAGPVDSHLLYNNSAVYGGLSSSFPRESSVILPDIASNARNSSNEPATAPFLGTCDHLNPLVLRSANSAAAVVCGPSVGFGSYNSIISANSLSSLPNKRIDDANQQLLDENLRLLALRHLAELSKQDVSKFPLETSSQQGLLYHPFSVGMQRRSSQEGTTPPEKRRDLPYLPKRQQDASENPIRSYQSCFGRHFSGDVEKLPSMEGKCNSSNVYAGIQKGCNISSSAQGISFCSKDLNVQRSTCHVHVSDEQPLLRYCQISNTKGDALTTLAYFSLHPGCDASHRLWGNALATLAHFSLQLGRTENANANDSIGHERFCPKESNLSFSVNCGCLVHSNHLTGCCISRGKASTNASKEHNEYVGGRMPAMVATSFDNGIITPEDMSVILAGTESTKIHSAQWRDVPSKVTGNCNTADEFPTEILNDKATIEDQLADTAAKRFSGSGKDAEALKEQQMSNALSECSAPAVTEASVEVNNVDSCIMDSGDNRYAFNPPVDEGSRIEKCGSSDDVLANGSWSKAPIVSGTADSLRVGSSGMVKQSLNDLNDEHKTDNSLKLKKVRNHIHDDDTLQECTTHSVQFGCRPRVEKRRKVMKWKRLDASFPGSGLSLMPLDSPKQKLEHSKMLLHASKEVPLQAEQGKKTTNCIYRNGPSRKRKRSALSSARPLSHQRCLHQFEDNQKDVSQKILKGNNCSLIIPKIALKGKVRQSWAAEFEKDFAKVSYQGIGKVSKNYSVGHSKDIFNHGVETHDKKVRPVVCGNSGIISNGEKLAARPVKIVSLSSILQVAKRCSAIENEESKLASTFEKQNPHFSKSEGCLVEKEREDQGQNTILVKEPKFSLAFDINDCDLSILKKKRGNAIRQDLDFGTSHGLRIRMKQKPKGTRKRSLQELTGNDKFVEQHLACNEQLQFTEGSHLKKISEIGLADFLHEKHPSSSKFPRKNSNCLKSNFASCEKACSKNAVDNSDYTKEPKCIKLAMVFPEYPKVDGVADHAGLVCVLCGYGGGAMTRAIRSRDIVKSLLEAWKNGDRTKSTISTGLFETSEVESGLLDPTSKDEAFLLKECGSIPFMRPMNIEAVPPRAALEMDFQKDSDINRNSGSSLDNFEAHNTITAGVIDPTVTQWVHMVCGLWMPGTRCPNVDTMSTFDVSVYVTLYLYPVYISVLKVCSICSRPGGLCIQCRVVECSGHFHPWCAHQKVLLARIFFPSIDSLLFQGLLQSEVEGDDDENVGFYGRCTLHATNYDGHTDHHLLVAEMETHGEKESTCARTEGYKGRKGGETLRHSILPSDKNRCLVTQEQINAWLHINGQKPCIKGLAKPPALDIELDCRKEYARYKQAKGWKHLVVYKSGIHGLGLYTSQFISHGAMVVEYVGEIVGLHVADKRETEYLSGKKLQYKSACYFFRIDKEHIIDATCKGGIARFVNHSCLPNCVAKVLSLRNEKKVWLHVGGFSVQVVFFADRDINPGEEITYDYHFNHEDEGKKIPCFCNSKNLKTVHALRGLDFASSNAKEEPESSANSMLWSVRSNSKASKSFLASPLSSLEFPGAYTAISHLVRLHRCTNARSFAIQPTTTEASLLFAETPQRNSVSQNALLSAHVRSGSPRDAWLLFLCMHRAGFSLDAYTFTPVVSACSALLDLRLGRQAHGLLIRTGISVGRTIVDTALVDLYSKCGCLADAMGVFRETKLRDAVIWNTMISGFVQHGRAAGAVSNFREMQKDDVLFSGFTLCSVLKACTDSEAIRQGRQIHAMSVVMGCCDSVLSTALIDFYSNCRIIGDAVQVYGGMSRGKDEGARNALISGYVQNKKYGDAFLILPRMQPNVIALTSVLAACSDLLDLPKGKQVHSVAIRHEFEHDSLLCNALLVMYAKCGRLTSARLVFDKTVRKDVVSWTSIIDAYGSHGHGIEALVMFKKMTGSGGVAPNSVTFLAVLSACGHSGFVEEARACFVLMKEKYGLDPGPEHHACFIDLLGRAGQINEAWDRFHGMCTVAKQAAAVWAALLNACRVNLDVARGEFVAERLLEVEPENPGNYVLLSNFYAAIGRWESVGKCREQMKERGLRKETGSSWKAIE
ncbi:hypothetical protein ACLOJK_002528 [Asimina triloba]